MQELAKTTDFQEVQLPGGAVATVNQGHLSEQARSVLRSLMVWNPTDPRDVDIPVGVEASHLRELEAQAAILLQPVTEQEARQMLATLAAGVKMETDKPAVALWLRYSMELPRDVMERAVDRIIRTHRYNTPVRIADLLAHAQDDERWKERLRWQRLIKGIRETLERRAA